MRNGMSVKEIYDKLDRYDRLQAAYSEELRKTKDLGKILQEIFDCVEFTANDYAQISYVMSNSMDDRVEFKHRAQGLREALYEIQRVANKYGINLD